jgi:aspartate aminotransferase
MNLPVLDEGVEVSLEREVVRLCAELGVNERTGLKLLHTILEDSRRIQGYSEGGARVTPGAVAAKARRLAASGKAVIRLDIGEPDFRPPRGVISSCIGALRRGRTHYTDPRGIPELLSALKDYLYEEYGCSLDTSNMMITPGGGGSPSSPPSRP